VTSVVVPFRAGGKSRLPEDTRIELGLAMLGDVLEVARGVATPRLVTGDRAARVVARGVGAVVVDDPGSGQGAAVVAGLAGMVGPVVVLNADVPCATASDLAVLAAAAARGAFALAEAADGTTNALALPSAGDFLPLYGPGSADRFRAHAAERGLLVLDLPLDSMRRDVDTVADLDEIGPCAGSRTRALLSVLLA
jgi:2-phospho-L-lactate guanylyltransferase